MSMAPKSEYEFRVRRAREFMRRDGMDGLIVTDPVTYFYFTGQRVPAWMRLRPSVFVLPLEGESVLISWSGPEMFARVSNEPYPSWVEDRRIYPDVPFTTNASVDWGILDALKDRSLTEGVLGIELGQETTLGIPVNDFVHLQKELPRARFVASGRVVWGCRMIKSAWEIECSRKACEIGGKAWKRVFEELRPGLTMREVQARIAQYYNAGGADLDSGPPSLLGATSSGGTFQKGDILYLDGGPAYMGYQMDYTRRAVFGKPSPRQRDEHNGMWEILFKVMDRMKPGVPVAEVFDYSQQLLRKRPDWRNYSDHPAKRIGHGIGLSDEPPSINAFDPRVLQEGMILTPEPKIESVDGLVNAEEHIVMTRTGWDQLSLAPGWELYVVG
jgi:Xaa-Pro aminopeptidase